MAWFAGDGGGDSPSDIPAPPVRCSECGAADAPHRCARCLAPYCSQDCQRRAWRAHRPLCAPAASSSTAPATAEAPDLCLAGAAPASWEEHLAGRPAAAREAAKDRESFALAALAALARRPEGRG